MFDLYLFNTIINALWYLFTILFVLYRYTKFFSYIYNFIRFCGKLVTGASYVYNFINPTPQLDLEAQHLQENRNTKKTLYSKCKEYIVKNYNYYYRKFTGNYNNHTDEYSELINRNNQNTFPLVETNYGSGVEFSTQLKKRENDIFNKKIEELEHSELDTEEPNCYIKNENKINSATFTDDVDRQQDGMIFLQDSNNYIFKIGETTTVKDKILLNENFKTDFIKSRESFNAFIDNENINLSDVNLDEFYSDSDSEISFDNKEP